MRKIKKEHRLYIYYVLLMLIFRRYVKNEERLLRGREKDVSYGGTEGKGNNECDKTEDRVWHFGEESLWQML